MIDLLKQIYHPMVRHLAWSLLSPDLACVKHVHPLRFSSNPELANWLAQLDANPRPLEDYIYSGNHRLLGSYFERLWQFFFIHHPDWSLLAHHVQIRNKKQTLGELDLLVEDAQGTVIHLELATKWYLQIPNCSGGESKHWLGPQTQDRLDLKLHKLTAKQFPFAFNKHTLEHLNSKGLPQPDIQQLVLKGGLFYKWNSHHQLAPEVPSDTQLFPWSHGHEVEQWIDPKGHYMLLEKHQWLAPAIICETDVEPQPAQAIIKIIHDHFDKNKAENASRPPYALMLCQVIHLNETTYWQEINRTMVIHKNWPNAFKSELKVEQ